MSFKPVPVPLAGFTRLGRAVYDYDPAISNIRTKSTDPDIVILCSWLDASPKHIAKYTTGYQRIYPASRILLITTALVDSTVASRSSQNLRIVPLLEVLTSLPRSTKVLLHLFSNGGALTSCLLAGAYRVQTGNALPIRAMVLDSSPGRPEHFRTHAALAMGFPQKSKILLYLLSAALHAFLFGYRLWKIVTWQTDVITALRRDLNDIKFVRKDVPRLYVYSDTDLMVRNIDVEDHAAEAKADGYEVWTEFWQGSGHCGHLMKDEKRYWSVVRRLWDEKIPQSS